MDTITIYNAARQDIKLNDIPHMPAEGPFKFSQGMLSTLNQVKFQQISTLNVQIEQENNKAKDLRKETIAFQSLTEKMLADGEKEKNSYSGEIEAENDNLKILKADRKQYLEDMMIRGYIPQNNTAPIQEEKKPDTKAKKKGISRGEIISFLLTWGVGEIFMTYIQYKSLRYEKDIESIIARSAVFAVVLFLIHYVAHLNRNRRKMIYTLFLGFSFLMLFFMLFGPLIINHFYPESKAAATAQQWSLSSSESVSNSQHTTSYPFWVEMYRKNDMIPGVLSFFFFLIMMSFIRREKKEVNESVPSEPVTPVASIQDEVAKRIAYYDDEIQRTEVRIAGFRNAQKLSLNPTTESLSTIYLTLKGKQASELSHIEERDRLVAKRQILLNEVMGLLGKYQLEFKEALSNDSVKNSLVRPDWPSENDIINHYQIKIL